MELIHKIIHNTYEAIIDEPVGFDTMKTTLKRGEYHGMSAQVTVNTLEFCGNVAHFIKSAYDEDIDTEIQYLVLDRYGNVFFSGVLDLSTLVEKQAEYYSVSLKVGEVGVKTMFNNRTTLDVDINAGKTIDGASLSKPTKYSIQIPNKKIVYTNLLEAKEDLVWTKETTPTERFTLAKDKSNHWINLAICERPSFEEFGTCSPKADIADSIFDEEDNVRQAIASEYYDPLIDVGTDFEKNFGVGSVYTLDISVTVTVEAINGDPFPHLGIFWGELNPYGSYDVQMVLMDEGGWLNMPWSNPSWIMAKSAKTIIANDKKRTTLNINYSGKILPTSNNGKNKKLMLGIAFRNNLYYNDNISIFDARNNTQDMKVTVKAGSYVRMELQSEFKDKINTQVVLVKDALNHVIRTISEKALTIQSNLLSVSSGNISLLGLVNGYGIRGIDKPMVVSFKDLIDSLDALGCIGYSVGDKYVRVERWDYFYNDEVVLEIDKPNEKSLQMDTDSIITQLTIGYKKYSTNEDINSIDSIHAERTFSTGVKGISKAVSKLCVFIADNYAIEETRRKALETTSDEFKYDENIFVFELNYSRDNTKYYVQTGCSNSSDLIDYTTIFNTRISPRRMAEQWKERLSLFNTANNITFVSGKVNSSASYKTNKTSSNVYYGDLDGIAFKEDQTITRVTPRMRSEVMKFKYPISRVQYQNIMANPYGLIRVDGVDYWLKEMQYEVTSGETEFKLIPKN